MKKKGFTLIELLGIFTILAVILLIAVPSITGLLKKQKENQYQSFLNNIFLATEAYLQSNLEKYTKNEYYDFSIEGDYIHIYLGELMEHQFLNSNTYDPKTKESIKDEKDYTVRVTLQEDLTYHYELFPEKLEQPIIMYNNALPKRDYNIGETIVWSDLEWLVMSNDDRSVTMILKNNYKTGIFGDSNEWKNSTAYQTLNQNLINGNEKIKNAINERSVVYQEQSDSYIRLPFYQELSKNIPNGSNTAFWTMSPYENGLYVGIPTGESVIGYVATKSGTYYAGAHSSLSVITKSSPTEVGQQVLFQQPNQASITYNKSASIVKRPTTYAGQGNHTSAKPKDYPNSYCEACPNAYCGARSITYYNDTCGSGGYSYYVLQSWYNPNYNTTTPGVSCASNTIYYANGNCKDFYQLTGETYEIGYRPVITVRKQRTEI